MRQGDSLIRAPKHSGNSIFSSSISLGGCPGRHPRRHPGNGDGGKRRELLGRASQRHGRHQEPSGQIQRPALCRPQWTRYTNTHNNKHKMIKLWMQMSEIQHHFGKSWDNVLSYFSLFNAWHVFMGDESGLQAGQSSTHSLLLWSHAVVTRSECGLALFCWNKKGRPWERCHWMAAFNHLWCLHRCAGYPWCHGH